MIDAGLPLVQCLEILAANQENPTFQKTLTGVRTTVEGGATLANAMRQYPKIFDDLTTNMIEAGETGGILDMILQRLAHLRREGVKLQVRRQVGFDLSRSSVICIAVLIVGALLKWVVPIFANLFVGLGRRPAAAHPHRHGPERALSASSGGSLSSAMSACLRDQADAQASAGTLLLRLACC